MVLSDFKAATWFSKFEAHLNQQGDGAFGSHGCGINIALQKQKCPADVKHTLDIENNLYALDFKGDVLIYTIIVLTFVGKF